MQNFLQEHRPSGDINNCSAIAPGLAPVTNDGWFWIGN